MAAATSAAVGRKRTVIVLAESDERVVILTPKSTHLAVGLIADQVLASHTIASQLGYGYLYELATGCLTHSSTPDTHPQHVSDPGAAPSDARAAASPPQHGHAAAPTCICPICGKPIGPGQRRISWLSKDARGESIERGALHLSHIGGAS